MSGRPRWAVNDLEHPDNKTIGSDKSDRQNGPDSEGQNGEGHKFPRPAWLFICVLRRDYFRHIRVSLFGWSYNRPKRKYVQPLDFIDYLLKLTFINIPPLSH